VVGCTEEPKGSDCLASGTAETVDVTSNEVKAESPTLPNLGAMKFSFDASVIPASLGKQIAPDLRAKCATQKADSIECVAFHYKVKNVGTRAVRWFWGCSEVFPEHMAEGSWRPVYENEPCTVNASTGTAILAGGVLEGDFSLAWGYDISAFRSPGEYTFRLTLSGEPCFASPDGRFCLTAYQNEPPVTSDPIIVQLQ
jgi:hypothetical protein